MTQPGDPGTCGFCGTGEGWLGEQGDESTTYLHSSVRTGEPGNWKYHAHPGSLRDERYPNGRSLQIIWCGMCLGGLAHMFQRYDDHNLSAERLALEFWLSLDGPRWEAWNASSDEEREAAWKYMDDIAVHVEKLQRERRARLVYDEICRRAGAPMQRYAQ